MMELLKDFKDADIKCTNYNSMHVHIDTEGKTTLGVYVDFVDEASCVDVYNLPVKVALAEKYLSEYFDISEDKINTYLINKDN